MSKRTRIVCIHEGKKGASIDPVFANAFIKAYSPEWLRPWETSKVRLVPYGGKTELRNNFVKELRGVITAGGDTTLIVFADIDDELQNGEELKEEYWKTAQRQNIKIEDFNKVVFIFAKDRIENWIEFLLNGSTDESKEGQRIKDNSMVRQAARRLANMCLSNSSEKLPPSLEWSCKNWHLFVKRMKNEGL